jgi:crotonobetainyl-CoA:carnitine CoA-transferase CaiB-like acyl-CoA transferase
MRSLQDLRVLAAEQYGAGPYGSPQLADLGAEVIKIEEPDGLDIGRYVPPYAEQGDSLFFETFKRTKRSITLDLRNGSRRPILEDLVRVSDAFSFNLRGERRGEDAAALPRSQALESSACLLFTVRIRHDRPSAESGGARLHYLGAKRLDKSHR